MQHTWVVCDVPGGQQCGNVGALHRNARFSHLCNPDWHWINRLFRLLLLHLHQHKVTLGPQTLQRFRVGVFPNPEMFLFFLFNTLKKSIILINWAAWKYATGFLLYCCHRLLRLVLQDRERVNSEYRDRQLTATNQRAIETILFRLASICLFETNSYHANTGSLRAFP